MENHFIDCKREVSSKSDNRETARDLASFAIDGGVVLIGVAEDKATRTFSLAPQPLSGLAEKIENIAANVIDPPLDVTPIPVPSLADTGLGYLYVRVSPSPFAPHMVDHVYFGRGETIKRKLSDADVLVVHARRRTTEALMDALIDEEIARDPVVNVARKTGHLYMVAQPLTAPPGIGRAFVRSASLATLHAITNPADEILLTTGQLGSSTPQEAQSVMKRAQGIALCTHALGPGRTMNPHVDERHALDIEFREDGGIRALFCNTRISVNVEAQILPAILERSVGNYAYRLASWAGNYAERIHYRGQWGLGFCLRGIRGHVNSVDQPFATLEDKTAYDADEYREMVTVTHDQLQEGAGKVASSLVERLFHAIDYPKDLRIIFP